MLIGNIWLTTKVGEIIKNYSKDKKAIIYAKSVKDMASKYRKQLTICKKTWTKISILFLSCLFNSISTASILCVFFPIIE